MRDPVLPLGDLPWEIRRGGLLRGVWRMLRHSSQRLCTRLCSHMVAVVHSTDLASWPDYEPDPEVTIRPGSAADLDRLERAIAPSVLRMFRMRLKQGQVMLVAEVEGSIGAFAWLCTVPDAYAVRAHGLELEPGEYIHYNSVTLPDFRRRGLYTNLQQFSRAYMRDLGYVRAYGGAVIGKPAPIRTMKNLDLRPVRLYHEKWMLGRLRSWSEPLPAGFSV